MYVFYNFIYYVIISYVLSKLIIYYPVISPPSIFITVLGGPWLKTTLIHGD